MQNIRKNFLYFAYDANMLSTRMHCCVTKKIKRVGLGKLEDWKMMFGKFSPVWYGTLPTIVKHCDCITWGSLWEMDECYRPKLDVLMGVASNVYLPITVKISALKAKGGKFEALTYRLPEDPIPPEFQNGSWKLKFRPSKIYHEELIAGSEEACLPLYYRKWIRKIPNNGYSGSIKPDLSDDSIHASSS